LFWHTSAHNAYDMDVVLLQNDRADDSAPRPDGLRSGRSALVVRTVRVRTKSIRVPSFLPDLLPKTTDLARDTD
jgi:hypothetical protein